MDLQICTVIIAALALVVTIIVQWEKIWGRRPVRLLVWGGSLFLISSLSAVFVWLFKWLFGNVIVGFTDAAFVAFALILPFLLGLGVSHLLVRLLVWPVFGPQGKGEWIILVFYSGLGWLIAVQANYFLF